MIRLLDRNHLVRIATGLTGIGLVVVTYAFLGHLAVRIAAAVIGLSAYFEYLRILSSPANGPRLRTAKICVALAAAAVFLLPIPMSHIWALGLLIAFTLALYRFTEPDPESVHDHRHHLDDLFVAGFGMFYVVGFLSFLPEIHVLPDGQVWLAGLVAMIWATDIAAYYGGHAFGRHKLARAISPGKTLEGALFGMLGALAVVFAMHSYWLPWASLPKLLCLAFLTSAISQLGDLFESLLKRIVGVKDSGFLLPGHGGMLDRFDSLILATPFYYLLLRLWVIV